MTLGIEREGLAEPLRELAARGTPMLGTCAGHDHARPRPPRPARHRARERNAFGRQLRSFEADLDVAGVDGGPVRAVFIRAPWVAEHGAERRGAGRASTAIRSRCARATCSRSRSIPSWPADARLHERFARRRRRAIGTLRHEPVADFLSPFPMVFCYSCPFSLRRSRALVPGLSRFPPGGPKMTPPPFSSPSLLVDPLPAGASSSLSSYLSPLCPFPPYSLPAPPPRQYSPCVSPRAAPPPPPSPPLAPTSSPPPSLLLPPTPPERPSSLHRARGPPPPPCSPARRRPASSPRLDLL